MKHNKKQKDMNKNSLTVHQKINIRSNESAFKNNLGIQSDFRINFPYTHLHLIDLLIRTKVSAFRSDTPCWPETSKARYMNKSQRFYEKF